MKKKTIYSYLCRYLLLDFRHLFRCLNNLIYDVTWLMELVFSFDVQCQNNKEELTLGKVSIAAI